jgi:LacI family transcriptional regulator
VLLPDLYGGFFSEVIRGIDQAAGRSQFQILISSSHADTGSMLGAVRAMRGRIDGLIAMVPDRGSLETVTQAALRFPLVLLNPYERPAAFSSVTIPNRDGASVLVSHLIETGHRRIAMLCGPEGNGDADERRLGYRDALRGAEIPLLPELEIAGDFTEHSGYVLARKVFLLDPAPTAVFAANDQMALGLLSALRDAGIAVPGDVAVAGFDDTMIARYLSPPLTTVRVDAYEMGRAAVRLLLDALSSPDDAPISEEVVPAQLVVRRSCGCPAEADRVIGIPPGSRASVSTSTRQTGDGVAAAGLNAALPRES